MHQVFWTPTAEADLDEILYFIAREDNRPEIAIKVFHDMRYAIYDRIENRVVGKRHPLAPDEWRFFSFKRWLIFYQPISNGIEVMRVLDGARDLPNTL